MYLFKMSKILFEMSHNFISKYFTNTFLRYLITLFDYLLRRKQARLRRPELANVSSRCWQFACRLAQTGILRCKALHGWPQSVGLHRMAAHAFFCKAMSDHTLCGTQSTDGHLKMHMNNVHIAHGTHIYVNLKIALY